MGLEDAKSLAALPGGLASCTGGGGGGAPAAAMRAQLPHKNKRRVEGRLQAAPRLAWPSHSSKAGSQGDTGCATRPLTTLRAPPPPPTAPAAVPAAASRARQQPSATCSALLLFWVYIRMPGRSGRPLGFKGKDASFLFCHAGGPATCTSGGSGRLPRCSSLLEERMKAYTRHAAARGTRKLYRHVRRQEAQQRHQSCMGSFSKA